MSVETKRRTPRWVREAYPGPFRQVCRAPAEVVYDLLADLRQHMVWSGERMPDGFRLLSLDAPEGPATVGTEFRTTGADGKKAKWHDRSVVTEATRPTVFEFVTEGHRESPIGSADLTVVSRYEIKPLEEGCEVSYAGRLTRFEVPKSWMRFIRTPIVGRLFWRVGNAFARKGFRSLIALAEERAGAAER